MTLPVVTSPFLSDIPNISHAFFTRRGGVSRGLYATLNGGRGSDDDQDSVGENRRRMTAYLGVGPERLATAFQVHSAHAVVALDAWPRGEAPEADAVISSTPGLAVGISTADCAPLLFADGRAGVVGAAHAGWKGALNGIVEATVEAMEKLGARRGDMIAVLGPCIRQPSYEVGAEFAERFRAEHEANAEFFVPSLRDGHLLFDLGGYVVQRLNRAAIGTIHDLDLDTYPDEERFFSYRRATHRGEPDYGRLVAAIALR